MPVLSTTRAVLRPSVFAELQASLDAFATTGGDLIGLHLGDTYLEPPQAARLAGVLEKHDSGQRLYRYGAVSGLSSLRKAIAAELVRRGRAHAGVGEQHVIVGAGATHALFAAAQALLDPGDDVLLASPYWPLAHGILAATGARPVDVPVTQALYSDPSRTAGDLLRAALTPRTKAVYLITPNNPDGKVLRREDLESVAELALERDLWVFADEAYADFTFGPPHLSIAGLPGMAERTITAYSFAKSHALAGLRVGCVIAPEVVVAATRRVTIHSVFNVPELMQHAAEAALASGQRWTDRALLLYKHSLDGAVQALQGLGATFHVPEGGTYVFVDFKPILDGKSLQHLLERGIARGVLLAPGSGFGVGYETCARLCFTSEPLPRVVEGIARLRLAIGDLHGAPGSVRPPPGSIRPIPV